MVLFYKGGVYIMCDNDVINAIVQIISTVGFPIAMCLLSFYQSNYILKENTKAIQDLKETLISIANK